jgi:hypothetical protein
VANIGRLVRGCSSSHETFDHGPGNASASPGVRYRLALVASRPIGPDEWFISVHIPVILDHSAIITHLLRDRGHTRVDLGHTGSPHTMGSLRAGDERGHSYVPSLFYHHV